MHPGSHSELRVLLAFVLLLTFGQAYGPAALLVKLKAIPVENGTLAEVEEELRSVCGKEGIILVVAKSSRVDDGSSNRVDMKKSFVREPGKGGVIKSSTCSPWTTVSVCPELELCLQGMCISWSTSLFATSTVKRAE